MTQLHFAGLGSHCKACSQGSCNLACLRRLSLCKAVAVSQDALGVSNFSSSDEAFVAEALFEAYRSQDVEEVKRVVKAKHVLSDLDNAVRLPLPWRPHLCSHSQSVQLVCHTYVLGSNRALKD